MKRKTVFAFTTGAACTASLALLIAAAPSQSTIEPDIKGNQPAETDPMAEMMRLSTPNEHHAKLGKAIGNWIAKTSFIMDPSQPPSTGEGTMSVKWVLGGRYIMSEFKMDFMGEPFEGIGYTGYDIAHEQYIATWADTLSTAITSMTGNMDEDGTLTLYGTATTAKGDNLIKIVSTWIDEDTMTDKFYDQMPDGTWFNSGTITYTRD